MTAEVQRSSVGCGVPAQKIEALRNALAGMLPLAVACSGGVDSSFLLAAAVFARRAIPNGGEVHAWIAVSPALSAESLRRARGIARQLGVTLEEIPTRELENPGYRANGPDRCFHCKSVLYQAFLKKAGDGMTLVDGTQASDVGDWRPGRQAARDLGVRSPLFELGWRKSEIRAVSRYWGLSTAELAGSPCLSSRVPTGTAITESALRRIERAEDGLRRLGFPDVRVRDHGELARVEVAPEWIERILQVREPVVDTVAAAGYKEVTLDLRGYRPSGDPNRDRPTTGDAE